MKIFLRILCYLVDFIIIMFAVQIVLIGFLDMPMDVGLTPITFFMMTYCIYNVLFTYYMHGQTPGKAVGRLCVVDDRQPVEESKKQSTPELHALFLRETCKALYFFPIVGQLAGLVMLFMIIIGRAPLHDRVGKTAVVFIGKSKQ